MDYKAKTAFLERLKTLPDSAQVDAWFEAGYTELDYLNYVKPLVIRCIVAYIKKSKDQNPLSALKKKLKTEKGKKGKVILEIIDYLEEVKQRYLNKDPVAKMILVNHGLIANGKQ